MSHRVLHTNEDLRQKQSKSTAPLGEDSRAKKTEQIPLNRVQRADDILKNFRARKIPMTWGGQKAREMCKNLI